MKKIILSVALVAAFMSGCKKKDDPAPTKTTTEYLTAHSWKISGAVSNVPIDADDDSGTPNTTDLWAQYYDDCEKDNVLTLAANGTGTFADAGVVCNPDETSSLTWSLSGNSLTLIIGGGGSQTITITSIDDNTLKVALPQETDPNNVAFIETDTFTKQ